MAVRAPLAGRFPFAPRPIVEAARRRRVRSILRHAYEHVPYYRETLRRLGLGPGDFGDAGDLARLPIIEREQLQRDPEYFLSQAEPADAYVKLQSGGSTGEPLTVFHHVKALFEGAGYRERSRALVMRMAGRRLRLRAAVIGSPLGAGLGTQSAFSSATLVPSSIRVTRLQLSLLDPPAENVPRLNAFKPDMIRGYGSYIEELFSYLAASGSKLEGPRVITYGSDALSDSIRRLITSRFGLQVLSTYGAIEAFHIGFECEMHHGFHLNDDLYPLRIVDPSGADLPSGESGDVVISNLVNRGTVLLNYRLGDVAARIPGRCECGRSLPMLSFLEGRTDDWLEAPSGERIHPQAVRTLFTEESDVLRYQVVQEAPDRFRALIVTLAGCDRAALERRLRRRFAERFRERPAVETQFVEQLPRTPGGKVRTVVSMGGGG